ncbi:MAG: hypothetical protein INH37_11880 [Myxococcaceae bacterium]|nr:hypothetical protein [Myxococcaceae bacterium]
MVTNRPVALRGANLVAGYAVGSALLQVVFTVVFRLLDVRPSNSIDALVEALWLGLCIAFAVGVYLIGTGIDRRGLAWTLVGLISTSELVSPSLMQLQRLSPHGSGWGSLASVLSALLDLGELVVFLVLFARLCGPTRRWAFGVALGAGVLGVLRTGLGFASRFVLRDVLGSSDLTLLLWGRTGLLFIQMGLTLALALGARAALADTAVVTRTDEVTPPEPRGAPNAGADLALGVLLLTAGVIISLASHATASSSSRGGRYVVATGLIAGSFIRFVRGMIRRRKAS